MTKSLQYLALSFILILVVGAMSLGLYAVLKGSQAEAPVQDQQDTRVYETVTLPTYGISFDLPKDYEACEEYDPNGPIRSPLIDPPITYHGIAIIWRDDSCNHTQDAPEFQMHLHNNPSKSLADIITEERSYFGNHTDAEITQEIKEVNGKKLHIVTRPTGDPFNGVGIVAGVSIGDLTFVIVGFGIDDFYQYKQEFVERLLSTIRFDKDSLLWVINKSN